MTILVLNGSPKTERLSVTMKHVEFLKTRFVEHLFESVSVALKIKKLEKDNGFFDDMMDRIAAADLILWAFPVYFYSVPGQLKRFIEIVHERKREDAFSGKYASSVSTSAGVYDYPAHDYLHAVSEDFGMDYFPGCSLKSVYFKDLMAKRNREEFIRFFTRLLEIVETGVPMVRKYPQLHVRSEFFLPQDPREQDPPVRNGKKLVVLTDHEPGTNLHRMLAYALRYTRFETEVVHMDTVLFKCGCTGCVQCQFQGRCFINDDVNGLFGEKVLNADAVLFAMTVKDRHISARWKTLLDRSFFMAKKNLLRNHHAAFIFSGPVMASPFVSEFVSIYSSSRCLHNTGFVSDEFGGSDVIAGNLKALMSELAANTGNDIRRPYIFHNRAYFSAMKDLMFIYGLGSNTARYYRRNGLFDYPQRRPKMMNTRNMLNFLFNFPLTRNYFRKNLNSISARQYQKIVDKQVKAG